MASTSCGCSGVSQGVSGSSLGALMADPTSNQISEIVVAPTTTIPRMTMLAVAVGFGAVYWRKRNDADPTLKYIALVMGIGALLEAMSQQ